MNFGTFHDVADLQAGSGLSLPKRPWRVVIADDEALPAELLKRNVLRLGHLVVGSAQNGVEIIALARQLKPDVVVMDLRMPVMDGWTAMAELSRAMLCPIVVVSALDDRESLEQAVLAGASAFLTKPVREDDLERALELAVARFVDLQELFQWRAKAAQRAQEQASREVELENVNRELREMRALLVNAARRAAVASLAYDLAHEINNALTPILGNAQMIAVFNEKDPELVQRANQIMEHAQRIAGWTAFFRQVTLGGNRECIPFSFNGIVRDVVGLYADRLERAGIQVQISLDNEMPVMYGYPGQIQEVLLNLLQNAVEALRQGDTLALGSHHDADADTALFTLSDSGTGIRPEHLAHIYEPGFTTRASAEQSNALGWGLFTAKQIVQAHGGMIEIASPVLGTANGTTVQLTLPLSTVQAQDTPSNSM